jgi:hypothetical protein
MSGCTTRSTRRVPPTSPRSSSRSTRTCASWAAAASTAAAISSSPEETCSPRARVSQVKPSKGDFLLRFYNHIGSRLM